MVTMRSLLLFELAKYLHPGPEKSAVRSSNAPPDIKLVTRSIVRDIVFPDSEDILCYQMLPEDEFSFL